MNLTSIKSIQALLTKHNMVMSKSLGQNFLINPQIPAKIAKAAEITADSTIVEIGPGIGCLTQELAKLAKKVVAVEIDKKLIPILTETLAEYDNIQLINADFMDLDLKEFFTDLKEPIHVVANLPYYITTPIIMALLEKDLPIVDITVMIQKEVAQRFVASAGNADYGSITVSSGYYANAKILFNVPPANFFPAPKVDSTVVKFNILNKKKDVFSRELLMKLIQSGFSMRRKTFVNNISATFLLSKEKIIKIFDELNIKNDIRAERLILDDFIRISDKLYELND